MSASTVSNTAFREFGGPSVARKDLLDVTGEFATEKWSTLLKASYVFPGFAKELGYLPKDNPSLNIACRAASLGKLSRSPFEAIGSTHKFLNTLSLWWHNSLKTFKQKYDKKIERQVVFSDVIRDAHGLINPTWEVADLFLIKTVGKMPKAGWLANLEGANGYALALMMGWNAYESLDWMANSKYSETTGKVRDVKFREMSGYLLKLAKEINFVVLGVMVFLSAFFQFVFTSLTFSAVVTGTVVLTMLEFYHERLLQEKKIK